MTWRKKALFIGFFGVLMGYVLVGYTHVPFHGDEADHLFKSRDFITYFVESDPNALRVRPPVAIDSEEHIRLLTGTTTAYLTGYALWSAGVEKWEWPAPWYYGLDYTWNIENGRRPEEFKLHRARLVTTLLTMLSIPLAANIAYRMGRFDLRRPYLASLVTGFLVATHPVWLLNGRRVMQEAALGTFSLMAVWLALLVMQKPTLLRWIGLSIIAGLCLASKPTGVIAVGAVMGALIISQLGQRFFHTISEIQTLYQSQIRQYARLLGVVFGTAGVYILLTPAIWDAPLDRMHLAGELRLQVLQGQTKASAEAYDSNWAQGVALIQQPFLTDLQYYESPAFEHVLDNEIAKYEQAYLDGWQMSRPVGIIWTGMAAIGLGTLIYYWRYPTTFLALVWTLGTAAALGISVPLAWQRYYLLWSLICCILAGIGLQAIFTLLTNRNSWMSDSHG
ncbi:MAG: glycosyltransferase family 39 protein [Anaerolineae bacterium]|nr:glycosyltransferase family 39 protein [Anaerolineae bacterium]